MVAGEALLDIQACNVHVIGTSYEGRVRRWFENDLENRWREAFRRQERIVREREQAKQQREAEERDMRERLTREFAEKGRGKKGGKNRNDTRQPYGGKGRMSVGSARLAGRVAVHVTFSLTRRNA